MTTQFANSKPEPPPNPDAYKEVYGNPVEPSPTGPKIKVLCKKTLRFIEAAGTPNGRHMQVEAKPEIQEVDSWIQKTPTFEHGTKDGSIILITGRSMREPLTSPPTVEEVMTARGCDEEEAQKIVDRETVMFNQGEYPYPPLSARIPAAPVAAEPKQQFAIPPTLAEVMAAGYSEEVAKGIVEREQARAADGIFPYGTKTDPASWAQPAPVTDSAPVSAQSADASGSGAQTDAPAADPPTGDAPAVAKANGKAKANK